MYGVNQVKCVISYKDPITLEEKFKEFPIERTEPRETFEFMLENLTEGQYDFSIVTYDPKNNTSIPTEVSAYAYGELYQQALTNRILHSISPEQKEIVNESIKKNKSSLIQEKISIDIHDLEIEVYTDNKWIVFILNQIIQNSIKYRKKENSVIEIYANQGKENVILYIKDNGIGIKQGEITRVFEKGFTGTNGRLSNKKSTGIGLYLCKKLCNKLGIGIELNSVQNEGTEVKLVFPKDSYIELK